MSVSDAARPNRSRRSARCGLRLLLSAASIAKRAAPCGKVTGAPRCEAEAPLSSQRHFQGAGWQVRESNPRPTVYQTVALPTELTCQVVWTECPCGTRERNHSASAPGGTQRARSADTASIQTSVRRNAVALCRTPHGPGRRNGEAPMAEPTGASLRRDFPEGCRNQPSELMGGLVRNDAVQAGHPRPGRARHRLAGSAISDVASPHTRVAGDEVQCMCVGLHKGCAVYSAAFACQENYNKFTLFADVQSDASGLVSTGGALADRGLARAVFYTHQLYPISEVRSLQS